MVLPLTEEPGGGETHGSAAEDSTDNEMPEIGCSDTEDESSKNAPYRKGCRREKELLKKCKGWFHKNHWGKLFQVHDELKKHFENRSAVQEPVDWNQHAKKWMGWSDSMTDAMRAILASHVGMRCGDEDVINDQLDRAVMPMARESPTRTTRKSPAIAKRIGTRRFRMAGASPWIRALPTTSCLVDWSVVEAIE